MELNEAKEILKNNGYLLEASRKQKGEEFFNDIETALKDNFDNVALIKKLKSNSKAKYSFDTKEYHCNLELEFDYGEKGLDDEGGDIYAFLDFDGSSFADDFFGDDEIDKITNWIKTTSKEEKEEEKESRKKEELAKKKTVVKKSKVNKPKVKKPKYTDLYDYKQDLYDALTARGLGMEFALDYVNGLDRDFMLDHQDIKALADEAEREWG